MPENTTGNTKPIFPGTPKTSTVAIANADGTTKKTLVTAGVAGARLDQIRVCSDDTAAVTLQFFSSIDGGATWVIQGEVIVPAGSGTNDTALWVEALDSLNSENAMAMQAAEVLGVAAKTAVTSGKTVTITARWGDF